MRCKPIFAVLVNPRFRLLRTMSNCIPNWRAWPSKAHATIMLSSVLPSSTNTIACGPGCDARSDSRQPRMYAEPFQQGIRIAIFISGNACVLFGNRDDCLRLERFSHVKPDVDLLGLKCQLIHVRGETI